MPRRSAFLGALLAALMLLPVFPAPTGGISISPPTAFAAGALAKDVVTPDFESLRALEYLNGLRTAAGLPKLAWSPALGTVAARHAQYLALNPRNPKPHEQRPKWPGAFGTTLVDRAAYFGYHQAVNEVIAHEGPPEEAVDNWLASLYHRIPLIHPQYTEMGYGWSRYKWQFFNVLNPGGNSGKSTVVRWPYPGQKNVPLKWENEIPDPLRLHPGAMYPVGTTVSITFPGALALTLDSAELFEASGSRYFVYTFSPANDDLLTDTVAMIPAAPLSPGTTYTVRMSGMVNPGSGLKHWSEEWSFTTRGIQVQQELMDDRLILKLNRKADGVRVFLNGVQPAGLKKDSETQISFILPVITGRYEMLLTAPDGTQQSTKPLVGIGKGTLLYAANVTLKAGTQVKSYTGKVGANETAAVTLQALEDFGVKVTPVPEVRRIYLEGKGKRLRVTEGSPVALLDGKEVVMPMAAIVRDGVTYLPAWAAEQLTGARVSGVEIIRSPEELVAGYTDLPYHGSQYVGRLLASGAVSGFADGTFRPYDSMERATFLKMLVVAMRMPLKPGETGDFSDVSDHWIANEGYLGAAIAKGIIRPAEAEGGEFRPDALLTREEAAVMLVRATGLEQEAANVEVKPGQKTARIAGYDYDDTQTWRYPGHIVLALEFGLIGYSTWSDGWSKFAPQASFYRLGAVVAVGTAMDVMATIYQ